MSSADTRNAREILLAVAEWLAWQDENLSFGLRSPEHGIKLWRYWQARPAELPEMADEQCEGVNVAAHRRKALGYDPLSESAQRAALDAMESTS